MSSPAAAQRIVDLLLNDPGVAQLGGINPRGLYQSAFRVERPCERCAVTFTPAPNNPHARFCSSACYKGALRSNYRQARSRAAT